MGKVIDLFKDIDKKPYGEINKIMESAIQIVIGVGVGGLPTELYITESDIVVGRVDSECAEVIIACLRDAADAVEQAFKNEK